MMPSLLLKNARLWGRSETACFVDGGKIASFGEVAADEVIDCGGALLLPALVDYQSFCAELLAATYGFCEVWSLLPDNRHNKSPESIPPLTIFNEAGEEVLADMGAAAQNGKRFFSNGLASIGDNHLMKQAMTYLTDLGATLVHQPQDPALANEGVMNEGKISAELGLRGIPAEAEIIMLARDLELVRLTGCAYIAGQLSTARGVEMMRRAKAEGLPVKAGVSINHLLLTEEAIGDFRTFCKLTPPLRTEADRQALIKGVQDGTLDKIVSAHLPQSQEGKRLPFAFAADGSLGLETFLSAIFLLAETEELELKTLLEKITPAPHALCMGAPANLVCFDDKAPWQLDVAAKPLPSKTQNSALDGITFTGKIKFTIINGEKIYARSD